MTDIEKLTAAIENRAGKFHSDDIADETGVSGSKAYSLCQKMLRNGQLEQLKDGRRTVYKVAGSSESTCELSVHRRFELLDKFVTMIAKKKAPSMLLYGTPGTGKSYTVIDVLKANGLRENDDYIVMKGHSSPLGLYRTLLDHREQIIIADDCDSIWRDGTSVNILKAALDSHQERWISWKSQLVANLGLEEKFLFTGQVIFISNLHEDQLDPAVISRTMAVNLALTPIETMERAEELLPFLANDTDASLETKEQTMAFLKEIANNLKEPSLRTVVKAIKIWNSEDCLEDAQDMIKWTLC